MPLSQRPRRSYYIYRMLQTGDVIKSPRGTRVEILENTPERISFQRTFPPLTGGTKGKAHRHTSTFETFQMLGGDASALVDGREQQLQPGETLEIQLGSSHANPYTKEGKTATLVHSVTPRTRGVEVYFTSWLHWLEQGEADANDEPTTLQIAAIIKEGGRAGTWTSRLPVFVQRIGLPILGLVAELRGIRAVRVAPEPRAAVTS
jgi:mannose-6-phosphate isomerase-like protein (cupin superfamily)